MRKWAGIFTVAVLMLALVSCGTADRVAAHQTGTYLCTALDNGQGTVLSPQAVFPEGCRIVLENKGVGLVEIHGKQTALTWMAEGTGLSMYVGDEPYAGTIENNLIQLNLSGMQMTFTKQE